MSLLQHSWTRFLNSVLGLSRLQRVLSGVVAIGLGAHLVASVLGRPLWDGALYGYIGGSVYSNHSLVMDWDPTHAFPAWEYGILYPFYLSFFYASFSFTVASSQAAALVASVFLVGVGYWTTHDLFGRTKGLAMAALLSLDPTLLVSTSYNYADPFVLAFFIVAIWALLKGLRDDRYIVIFGLAAGLFYMSKTIIGWAYVVPALTALLGWRWWRARPGWSTFRWWIAGVLVSLAFVVVRETEIQLEGRAITTHDLPFIAGNLGELIPIAALKLPFLVLMLGTYAVFWLPELRGAVRFRRESEHELLLLVIMGMGAVVWAMISVIAVTEPQNPVFWQDNMRYVLFLVIPLLWLVFSQVEFDIEPPQSSSAVTLSRLLLLRLGLILGIAVGCLLFIGPWLALFIGFGALAVLARVPRKRLAVMLLVFAVAGLNTLSAVDQPAFVAAAGFLNPRLRPGDLVAIDRHVAPDLNAIELYNYLSEHNITVTDYAEGMNATFILSQVGPTDNVSFVGYTLAGSFRGTYERTWLAKCFSLLLGGDSALPGEVLNVWQMNSTLPRSG